MHASEASTPDKLNKALEGVHESFKEKLRKSNSSIVPVAGVGATPVLFKQVQSTNIIEPEYAYALMKACLENKVPITYAPMSKASISVSSNIYGYDLRDPSIHLIPFLSPIRDETPRVQHPEPGNAVNWKVINASQFTTGGFAASPWLNEGQRAPLMTVSATTVTAPYATIGLDGSDTYEAQSSGRGFEDPLSTARFLGLEGLMVKEEDAILGGNKSLKLGACNTPTLTTGTTGGSLSATTYYVACVALSYEGYRNQVASAGLVPQLSVTTPDNKVMQVNGGIGKMSAISTGQATSGTQTLIATVTPQIGEFAYAWYVGTASALGSLHLQSITTVPTTTYTTTPTTSGQLGNAWTTTTDYSVNDGTTGGGANQVTAFDGFMTQALIAAFNGGGTANAYQINLAGAKLTASGRGSVKEIDTALQYAWNTWRITYDAIWVNAQELTSITNLCLTNASGPLVHYELNADGEHYDLTASGTIGFYFNPYIPGGGRKIPIYVHPTLTPGSIFLQGKRLPPYFKKSNMTNVAEVVTKRDYYSIDWAPITREYQFGTYSEEVLAVYAPFALGMIQGCLPS